MPFSKNIASQKPYFHDPSVLFTFRYKVAKINLLKGFRHKKNPSLLPPKVYYDYMADNIALGGYLFKNYIKIGRHSCRCRGLFIVRSADSGVL